MKLQLIKGVFIFLIGEDKYVYRFVGVFQIRRHGVSNRPIQLIIVLCSGCIFLHLGYRVFCLQSVVACLFQ